MSDPVPPDRLSQLPREEKAVLAGSFGGIAFDYERFRPGPPQAAVDWLVPHHVGTVVDLGAGTGALTRMLVDRADEVVAVEPDERMRAVLADEVPTARAVEGKGESIPVPDGFADAVLASSSWHWMDPVAAEREAGRVLVPGGTLGVLWSGPDPEGAFLQQVREVLAARVSERSDTDGDGAGIAGFLAGDATRPAFSLEIAPGVPFGEPDHEIIRWDVALDADDLIGLLATFGWIITMDEDRRTHLLDEARRLLKELLGVEGDVTINVGFRADAWRSRHDP